MRSPVVFYRGLACLIGILGTLVANRPALLLVGILVVLIFLSIQGKLNEFIKFGYTVLLPLGAILICIQCYLMRKELVSTHELVEGVIFPTILSVSRVALLGGIFSVAVLSLSPACLIHLFQTFGIRGQALVIVISCLNLWSDFRNHIQQISLARCARGLMPDRRFSTRLRQVPHIIRTLFISTLTASFERASVWQSHGLVNRFERISKDVSLNEDGSRLAGIVLLGMSIAWTTTTLIYFLKEKWTLAP